MAKVASCLGTIAVVATAKDIPLFLPQGSGFGPADIGVVINIGDPQSVAVGAAYQKARSIPAANVVQLNFSTGEVLAQADFFPAYAAMTAALPATVQALALTWLWPYRVDCMSVTSALAFNFSEKYCGALALCGPLEGSRRRLHVSVPPRRQLPTLHPDSAEPLLQLVLHGALHGLWHPPCHAHCRVRRAAEGMLLLILRLRLLLAGQAWITRCLPACPCDVVEQVGHGGSAVDDRDGSGFRWHAPAREWRPLSHTGLGSFGTS